MAIYNTLHLLWGLWKPVTSEVTLHFHPYHSGHWQLHFSMAFRPGCPQANTSCTWTLIDVFVEFCLAWKSLVCLELEAQRNALRPEATTRLVLPDSILFKDTFYWKPCWDTVGSDLKFFNDFEFLSKLPRKQDTISTHVIPSQLFTLPS